MDLNFSQCVLCNVRFMTRFFQRLVTVMPSDFRREDAGRTVPEGSGEGVVPIRHLTHTNLRTKNREFGFTISWFFQRGKENNSVKSLENSDVDSGVFKF